MYWHVLILTVQSGYAALLDLLLQFCLAESAVLETSASNHTNASSNKLQSTLGLAPDSGATLFRGGAGFSGDAAAASAAGAGSCAGSAEGDSTAAEGDSTASASAFASPEGAASGTVVVLVTNLWNKGLATGQPPALAFLRKFSQKAVRESWRSVVEVCRLCPKCVRK